MPHRNRRVAIAIPALQNARRCIVHPGQDKCRGPLRRFQIPRFIQNLRAPGERRNHQPVPGGQNFVVQMRPHALGADLKQRGLGRVQFRLRRVVQSLPQIKYVLTRKLAVRIVGNIALGLHAINRGNLGIRL